jgi:hypothetical protein
MTPNAAFAVLQFSSANLFRFLGNERCSPDEVAQQPRAQYLYGYLHDIGAQTIVVENVYTDGDYLDDFASYYVRCYAEYDRCCRRLHFFSDSVTTEILAGLVVGTLPSDRAKIVGDGYLGFVVARPLPSAVVGRTVLRTYPTANGRRHYTVVRDYESHLFGTKLRVRSLPFQEQDSVLAACATVALWCAFHKTAELFGTTAPRPSVITGAANRGFHRGRLVPSHGLIVEEMCQAVRDVGLEPELVDCYERNVPLISLAYAHLRMGVPVILVVKLGNQGLHAITLTGYSLQDKVVHSEELAGTATCLPMMGLRIDELYGHDDQVGPFARLIVRSAASPVLLEGDWKDDGGQPLRIEPIAALIPVYNKVRVTFLDVQSWLTRLHGVLPALGLDSTGSIEWDLSLTTTNAYKELVKSSGLPSAELERLLLTPQPRFIWRAVLRVPTADVLELLADATDMARSFPMFDAIWHHEGFKSAMREVLTAPAMQPSLVEALTPRFLDFLKSKL